MFCLKEKKLPDVSITLQQSLSGGIVLSSEKQILPHGKTITILTN